MTLELTGTATFADDLNYLITAEGWTDSVKDTLLDHSDGYKVIETQTLGQAGTDTDGANNGVCFGIDPAINGGYCHIYQGDGNADQIKVAGHYVRWIPAADWDAVTYPGTGVGWALSVENDAIVLSPDCSAAACAAGMESGDIISAEWYQYERADTYEYLYRMSKG
jgi:hypothetical protein